MREGQRDEKIERGRLNMGKRRMHIYIYIEREKEGEGTTDG